MEPIDFETEIRTAVSMIKEIGAPMKLKELNETIDYLLNQIPENTINNEINNKMNGYNEDICDFVKCIIRNYIQVYVFIKEQCSNMFCETIRENAIVSRNKKQISDDYLIISEIKEYFDYSKVLVLINLL